jgi:hypothetical protein
VVDNNTLCYVASNIEFLILVLILVMLCYCYCYCYCCDSCYCCCYCYCCFYYDPEDVTWVKFEFGHGRTGQDRAKQGRLVWYGMVVGFNQY